MSIDKLIFFVSNYLIENSLESLKDKLEHKTVEYNIENLLFDNNKYCKNLIFRNEIFEIYIITWLPNQETLYHKHPERGCVMKILEGNLTETVHNKIIKIFNRNKGDCTYIHDDIGVHKIINKDKRSISLHIYSPPKFYD